MAEKVVLITGAGRGIGRVTALTFARRGARVMAVARTEDELAALAAEVSVEYIVESIATEEGCSRVVSETEARLGQIDVLVNNAGISAQGRVSQLAAEDWRAVMAVNLDAAFYLTKLTAEAMMRRRWGRIIMVSSTAGQLGAAEMSAYCASKHGLLGLMRAVAQEVGPSEVTCNAVCPGWVAVGMGERRVPAIAASRGISEAEVWAERTAGYPAKRPVSGEEVAETIAFLASEAASGINGEAVTIALGSVW